MAWCASSSMNLVRRFAPILGLLTLLALLPVGAQGHPERSAHFPPGTVQVPTVHFGGPRLIIYSKDLFDFQKCIARYQPGLKITNEALLGLKNLQIEGTGAYPLDVIIDGRFQKLNTVRADRADGAYFLNFTVQRGSFNALYVPESDGFVIDGMLGRWNLEYGFLTFATDHGLYSNCEAYGNGDSGIYPGGTSDINKSRGYRVPRYAIEVSHCRSHNNLIG